MSYLDRLMAQTGIDLVSSDRHVEPVSPIVEVDGQQDLPSPPAPQPSAASPATFTSRSVPDRMLPTAAIQRAEPVTTVPAHAPALSAEAPRASESETLAPEVVIEQYPARLVAELPSQIVERTRHGLVAQDPPVVTAPGATSSVKNVESPSAGSKAAVTAKHATFIEIRDWVAATPAADEAPSDSYSAKSDARGTGLPERSAVVRGASLVRGAEPERVSVPEAPHVELSIGALQVIVEAPATGAPPARPPPPPPLASSHPAAESPLASRLARRYIRL